MTAITDPQPGQLGHLDHVLASAGDAATDARRLIREADVPAEQVRRSIAYARAMLHRAEHHLDNHLTDLETPNA